MTRREWTDARVRRVADILRREWDPIGSGRMPRLPADEYDDYAPGVVALVDGETAVADLVAHLDGLADRAMGVGSRGIERTFRVAHLVVEACRLPPLPELLVAALADGTWRDPGPAALRGILGPGPDLQLFATSWMMRSVGAQAARNFVDLPQFWMVHAADELESPVDPRLVWEEAVFVGGSVGLGDDVLVAADLRGDEPDPWIRVFDWERAGADPWRRRCRLSGLLARLG